MSGKNKHNPSFTLMRPEEVCEVLNVSKSKIYRMIKAGELPSVLVGYSKRVHPDDLMKYIDRRRNPMD